MELEDILSPLPDWLTKKNYSSHQIGSQIIKYEQGHGFPEITEGNVVIFGLISRDEKNSFSQKVRTFFYSLTSHFPDVGLVDLGDFTEGETFDDTCEALSTIIAYCVSQHAIPVYLGYRHQESFGVYLAYEKLKKIVNLSVIDAMIDVHHQKDEVDETNWITYLIHREPNYLFNFSALAYQSYFVPEQFIDLFEKMHFDVVRLGKIRQNIFSEVEPIIRSTDSLSVDLNAIRFADFPASSLASPNGLSGEEICQIMRIAGMSENLSSLALFGDAMLNRPDRENEQHTSYLLIAQMLWYFVYGYYHRPHENPYHDRNIFLKYIVSNNELNSEIIFYKSNFSNRWWMEIPYRSKSMPELERHLIVPCTYEDYLEALNNVIPVRWWKTYQKLL